MEEEVAKNRSREALLLAILAAAIALGVVKRSPHVELEFPVTSPSTRGFGAPCDSSDFIQVSIFGQDRAWNERAVLPLRAALALAAKRSDYRPDVVGTYNCRTISGSTTWSHHAWALAVDFDPGRNPFGVDPSRTEIGSKHMDFVRAFERVGFVWGGRWSTPDAMHFEWDGPPVRNRPTLQPGDRGPAVEELEALLARLDLPVKRDGRYEGKDLIGVVGFQKKNAITDVEWSTVGPVTWMLMLEAR